MSHTDTTIFFVFRLHYQHRTKPQKIHFMLPITKQLHFNIKWTNQNLKQDLITNLHTVRVEYTLKAVKCSWRDIYNPCDKIYAQ